MTALENNQNITSIPIIDISGLLDNDIQTHQNIASHIRKACLDKGFFYITGHGVSKALQDKVFEYSKLFFSLPQNRKSSGPKSFLKQIEAMNH
jgi:isopenicillin N synthase-like dioxygenase